MSAVYGITGKFTASVGTDWVCQSSNPQTALQRAQALGATGQEVAHTLYDSTDNIVMTENESYTFVGNGTDWSIL